MSAPATEVLVLGAGVAGVTAAAVLKKAGMQVKVLEGQKIPGGRLRTVPAHFTYPSSAPKSLKGKGIPVDLGGSWIHGVAGAANPIYSLANLAGCSVVKSHWERAHLFMSDGQRAHRSILVWWMKLMSDITQFFEDEIEDPNMSISEALQEYLDLNNLGKRDMSSKMTLGGDSHDEDSDGSENSERRLSLDSMPSTNSDDDVNVPKELQAALARIALVIAGEWEWAERMEVLSALKSFDDGEQLGADVMIPQGYWTVFQNTLMTQISDDIIFDAQVVKINQKNAQPSFSSSLPSTTSGSPSRSSPIASRSQCSSKVTVTTKDGREWSADHVICTLPLGVLKQNSVKFVPELSDHKTISMARVGFGTMNKVYLQFEEAFWEDGTLPPSSVLLNPLATRAGLRSSLPVIPCEIISIKGHETLRNSFPDLPSFGESAKPSIVTSQLQPHCLVWMDEEGSGRFTVGVNYNVVVPHSNILCIMATGEAGLAIESMTDEEIIEEIMQKLRRCYEEDGEDREKRNAILRQNALERELEALKTATIEEDEPLSGFGKDAKMGQGNGKNGGKLDENDPIDNDCASEKRWNAMKEATKLSTPAKPPPTSQRRNSASSSSSTSGICSPTQRRRKRPIPNPCNHLITRWGQDKWTGGGSYASLVIGASHNDLVELARTEGKIAFAGEHTATDGYLGSVQGAYATGIRAAHQILSAASLPIPTEPLHPSFTPPEDLLEE